jgi:3-oxoacyl-[acyl-carrier protein] reductase
MSTSGLSKKVAVITGSSRGIGRAVAQQLSQSGASVVINYVQSKTDASKTVAAIKEAGGQAVAIQADVSRAVEIHRLFEETLKHFGKIDIVVAAAGVQSPQSFKQTSEEIFDRLFMVNAKGSFFTLQESLNYLENGGRLIAFSSSLTTMMVPGYAAYAGTKAAVEQFVRSLSKEVGDRGITVNAVAPGPVETDLLIGTETPQTLQFLAGMSPFGRLGQPNDIARVVDFLASEEAGWISGQIIPVNGALA